MSAIELKQRIIDEVNSITDETILTEIYQLLKLEKGTRYELTEQETQAVQEGLEDIKKGRVYTSNEANGQIQGWLKK